MITKTVARLGLSTSAVAFALLAVASTAPANAHPHDLLAQCQLPDGSWVMCDQTSHDKTTGGHTTEGQIQRPGSQIKNLTAKPKRQMKLKNRK